MSLSDEEIAKLLELLRLTEETEINCEQCLQQVAEFAEHNLPGKSIPESLAAVQKHLLLCGECREEYEVLQKILGNIAEQDDS